MVVSSSMFVKNSSRINVFIYSWWVETKQFRV